MDPAVDVTGSRARPAADVVRAMNGPTYTQDARYCLDALRLAPAVSNEVVKANA